MESGFPLNATNLRKVIKMLDVALKMPEVFC
jgi:hypothetical protein